MAESLVPVLHVADALLAAAWYGRLGFEFEWESRSEPHQAAVVAICRGPMRIFLSEHSGDARPGALLYLYVHDVHAIAAAFGAAIQAHPWGDETEIQDPDGNRLRLNTPRDDEDGSYVAIDQAIERDAADVLARLGFSGDEARAAVSAARATGPRFRSAADLVQEALRSRRPSRPGGPS